MHSSATAMMITVATSTNDRIAVPDEASAQGAAGGIDGNRDGQGEWQRT